MLEEIVLRTTALYALVNTAAYVYYVGNSARDHFDFNLKDHMNMALQTFRYNFRLNQIAATVFNAPFLLYDLYQLTQR